MIRKMILSAVLATVTMTGLAATASAAHPPIGHDRDRDRDHDRDRDRDHDRHRVRYEVLVRHRGHWDSVGTYRDREDAQRAAWRLQRQGEFVRIEVEYVRR